MLNLQQRKAIIDHTVTCPEVFGRAMQTKTTKKGFVENGMLDENTELYPDIIKMLQTCKLQDFKKEWEDLLLNNFSKLYQTMKKYSHISEEIYNRIGFPKDTNYEGKIVEKLDHINQEMRHRAKIISHHLQCKLRQKRKWMLL